jgi:hypothetical protein
MTSDLQIFRYWTSNPSIDTTLMIDFFIFFIIVIRAPLHFEGQAD